MADDREAGRRFHDGALAVRAELEAAAREYGDGYLGWVSLETTPAGTVVVDADESLYGGQLGVALFFAAVAACTDVEARTTVDRVVEPWLAGSASAVRGEGLGAMSGVGSLVYSFVKLYELLGDGRYLDRALEFARTVTADDVAADDVYDVNLGVAGTLLAVLSLLDHVSDDGLRDLAVRCGEHLLDGAVDAAGGLAWRTVEEYPTTGFAHGTAGIARALAALAAETGTPRFGRAARDAVRFENDLYDPERAAWAKGPGAPGKDHPDGWCWGPPGVALGRLGCLGVLDDDVLRRDVRRGVEAARRASPGSDGLCHGAFGNGDVLVEASRRTDVAVTDEAAASARAALDGRAERGHFRLSLTGAAPFASPSLMVGLAGVGYALLRLAHPERLPCVLLLE